MTILPQLQRLGSLKKTIHPGLLPRTNPFRNAEPLVPLKDFRTLKTLSKRPFAGDVFGSRVLPHLMHMDVRRYLAGKRAGLASTKRRGEVRGSSRKIHQQKGTGKARAGSSRAPHRRKGNEYGSIFSLRVGGRCFGPKPRDFSFKIPKKMILASKRSALALRYKERCVALFDPQCIGSVQKTKQMKAIIEQIPSKKVLIIHTNSLPEDIIRCGRGLQPRLSFLNVEREPLETYHLINHKFLFIGTDCESFIYSLRGNYLPAQHTLSALPAVAISK